MIDWSIKIVVFFGLTAGLFMGFQSVNDAAECYPAFKEKDQTAQLVIGGVCLALAGGLTYLLSMKFVTKENTTKVVGFACAAGATFLIVAGISMPTWAKTLCMVAGGAAGAYFVAGNEKQILSYGTGFIGAVMICHGLGSYIGGFPSFSNVEDIEELKMDYKFIGYIVGTIVLTVAGGYV